MSDSNRSSAIDELCINTIRTLAMDAVQQAMPALSPWNPHSGLHYRTWVNRLIAEAYAREIERTFPRCGC